LNFAVPRWAAGSGAKSSQDRPADEWGAGNQAGENLRGEGRRKQRKPGRGARLDSNVRCLVLERAANRLSFLNRGGRKPPSRAGQTRNAKDSFLVRRFGAHARKGRVRRHLPEPRGRNAGDERFLRFVTRRAPFSHLCFVPPHLPHLPHLPPYPPAVRCSPRQAERCASLPCREGPSHASMGLGQRWLLARVLDCLLVADMVTWNQPKRQRNSLFFFSAQFSNTGSEYSTEIR
jgi:hypothetical protein